MTTARTPQHVLNEFLQAELHHTMGAYDVAVRELERLAAIEDDAARVIRRGDLKATLRMNQSLRDGDEGRDDRSHPPTSRAYGSLEHDPKQISIVLLELANPVAEFYGTAVAALEQASGHPHRDQQEERPAAICTEKLEELGRRLAVIQDPQRRVVDPETDEPRPADAERARQRKLDRMKHRRKQSKKALRPAKGRLLRPDACVDYLLGDCLANRLEQDDATRASLTDHPLHQVVIAALTDGHLRMHHAEHELSVPFGKTLAKRDRAMKDIQVHLKAAISLHTFAYVTARSLPWIFAADEDERDSVIAYYQESCDAMTPPYCLWIAKQVSLLALHRRGFSYWLLDEVELAYKDFYKLRRQIRQTRRLLRSNVAFPPGARQFLDGLYALAEHHTGRIYQSQHGHDVALRHFKQATTRLQRLEPDAAHPAASDATARSLLHNSRWRVRLLIGQGKANYELGRMKASLLCNVQAWRCFLQLLESERRADANLETVDELIDWLKLVVDDPDLDKRELAERFTPLVNQFRSITRSIHLRSLAADIISRIGHTLVVLKLPDPENAKRSSDRLAHRALSAAAELDPRGTPIGVDLLTIKQRSPDDHSAHGGLARAAPSPSPIEEQWPGGGSEFETAARVIEYLLQRWIERQDEPPTPAGEAAGDIQQLVAAKLLPAFTTHTDSSNIKLAQVYRYLMQGPRPIRDGAARLEFVCARRYSSFFPFLPRPSAFRVRGGGYFVRILDDALPKLAKGLGIPHHKERRPFGIAIDPGVDYLDNLYRCGYGLADIDMVVVTHDHADHVAELDAMLALLYNRRRLGEERFRPTSDDGTREKVQLPIVGNAGICRRYGFYNDRKDPVLVMGFEDLERMTRPGGEDEAARARILLPPSMRFEAVETNHTDAQGEKAQGFVLSVEDEDGRSASIGFTSDTGKSDPWPGDADVVVAHVSTVPLPDLRQLAKLEQAPAHAAEETAAFERLWMSAKDREQIGRARHDPSNFLLRQLQFGFWSRAADGVKDRLAVSPLSPLSEIRPIKPADDEGKQSGQAHLYLNGLVELAQRLNDRDKGGLLLVGELREELGSFRSRIASELNDNLFRPEGREDAKVAALTADIGLAVEIDPGGEVRVLCSTCDLDNDMTHGEQFHDPLNVYEVCVKGEHEGVFYNCEHHNPQSQSEPTFVELVERYDVFGH